MGWTHLADTTPVSRKPHDCCLCGQDIDKGVKYVARRGVQDGEIMTMHMHAECEHHTKRWDLQDWESYSPDASFRGEALEAMAVERQNQTKGQER